MSKIPPRKTPDTKTSWDPSEKWYGKLVGEKGHYYHQSLILPNLMRLMGIKDPKKTALLDIGCGSGVLARQLPKGIDYAGVDLSKGLLDQAKQQTPGMKFIFADATKPLPIEKIDFDIATFILSLQNMENGKGAIEQAAKHLSKPGSKIFLILNHPAFRIPRQCEWSYDESKKLMSRQVNSYLSSLKIPIAMEPSKKEKSPTTYSFHNPLSTYITWLNESGFAITALEEWCSDKKSEGGRAKAEDRARLEIPMFMAIAATRIK
jgi:ubiquinone/menaquinone biosynthesis C-methylase UbiE